MPSGEVARLISYFSRFPGMGSRSAARIVVHLLKKKHSIMEYFMKSLASVYENSRTCAICGNIDVSEICPICADHKRDNSVICVVADISDLWSIERAEFFRGKYHVLGGKLSSINGVMPEDLAIEKLCERIRLSQGEVKEVIIAMSADLDGQTTMFFVNDKIKDFDVKITTLAHGVPVGSELEYLDDGTIIAAFDQRKDI
jgi:recombination protein RecR